MSIKQTGFSGIEFVLIVVIIGILSFTGWFVWNSQTQTNIALGDTEKSTHASPVKSVELTSKGVTNPESAELLTIARWSVQIPVKGFVLQAISTQDGIEKYEITTTKILDEAQRINCSDTNIGTILKRPTPKKGDEPAVFSKQIRGFYYAFHQRSQASCFDKNGNAPEQINDLQDSAAAELSRAIVNTKDVIITD